MNQFPMDVSVPYFIPNNRKDPDAQMQAPQEKKPPTIETLQQEFNEGMNRLGLKDMADLTRETQMKKKEISQLEKDNRPAKALDRKNSLNDLEQLISLSEQIEALKPKAQEPKQFDKKYLEKELEEGLAKYDLKNAADLMQEIENKKNEIADLMQNGRPGKASDRKLSLDALEHLLAIAEQLEVFKPKTSELFPQEVKSLERVMEEQPREDEMIDYQVWEKELADGLKKYEIHDSTALKEEIEKKKQEVEELQNKGREKKALERKKSLEDLLRLEQLSKKIEDIKAESEQLNNKQEYDALNLELTDGLAKYEIRDLTALETEIKQKQNEIATLEKADRHKKALERKKSLENLEQLQAISNRIEELKSKIPRVSAKEYEGMKKKLRDGLASHELKDATSLIKEIEEKKEEIAELEQKGRQNKVLERKKSLESLEQLQALYLEIEELELALKPKTKASSSSDKDSAKLLEESKRESDMIKTAIVSESKEKESLAQPKEGILEPNSSNSKREKGFEEAKEALLGPNSGSAKKEDSEEVSILTSELGPRQLETLLTISEDFSTMPNSSERSLLCLIYYIYIKLVGQSNFPNKGMLLVPERLEEEIQKEFVILKSRLKIEELETLQIIKSLEKSQISVKNQDWKSSLNELEHILKKIRPLNMPEMFRLIKKVDNAVDLVKDQDIILFLGGTGTGKSTTIHFLAGSKMAETEIKGLKHIAPVEIKNPILKEVRTSPFAVSETRYITPIPVNLADVGSNYGETTILCDSPGFEDTSGPEVDIANGIGIVQALQGCKSVKPVVLISYKSIGDRLTGLKDLAHILVGMIPGVKDHMKAFSYFFTKYPLDERKRIFASLDNIKSTMSLEEKADIGFMSFFNDMLRKTKNGAIAIDPLHDNPGDILDNLNDTANIKNPQEVFQISITEKSKGAVQEQVRRHQLSIMAAVKRGEYAFVKYKLDQLRRLDELLQQESITQVYNELVQHLSKHLVETYHAAISALNRCLMNENMLNQKDVEEYQAYLDSANAAEELRSCHLGNEVVQSSAFVQNVNIEADKMLLDLKTREIDDLATKTILDKIKLLSGFFVIIRSQYKEGCELFEKKVDNVIVNARKAIESDEFDKSADEMSKLLGAISSLEKHLSSKSIEQKYIQLKEFIVNSLKNSILPLHEIFKKEKLEKTDIDALIRGVSKLELAKGSYPLQSHIKSEDINLIYNSLLEKILHYFADLNEKIVNQFQKQRENSFQSIEQLMKEMILIRTIPTLDFKTSQSYFSTLEMLCGFIQELRRDAEQILISIFQKQENVNYNKLFNYLNGLQNAKWIGELRPGVYSDVMNNVEEQITQHIKSLQIQIKEVDLDLENPDKIAAAYQIVTKINEMKPLGKISPTLTTDIELVNSVFEGKTQDTLNAIKGFLEKWKQFFSFKKAEAAFSDKWKPQERQSSEFRQAEAEFLEKWADYDYQTLSFKNAEKSLIYLLACHQIKLLNKEHSTLLYDLEDFIREYSCFVQNEMKNCLNAIMSYKDGNREELFSTAQKLSNRFEEVFEIKKKFSQVYSRFDPEQEIITEWNKKLFKALTELTDDMQKLSVAKQYPQLSDKLLIAKALSLLDEFSEKGKFIDIYHSFQDSLFSMAPDNLRQGMDAIKDQNFSLVFNELSQLEQMKDIVFERHFAQLKKVLNDSLENLIEETKSMARLVLLRDNVTQEKIEAVVKNLKKIQNAKTILSVYLDDPAKLDDCVQKVKETISRGLLEFLKSIEGLIGSHNFYEADIQKNALDMICGTLESYCEQYVVDEIKKVEQNQKDTLNVLTYKYSSMTLGGYLMNPPKDIFEKFEKVNSKTIYIEALNIIKEKVVETFRKELKNAKSSIQKEDRNIHMRNFESALNCLPDHLKSFLALELRGCKDDITHISQEHENELTATLQGGDLRRIASFIKTCQAMGMQPSIRKVEDSILKQVQEIKVKIDRALEQGNTKEAFNHVKKMFEYDSHLGTVFNEIKQPYTEVKAHLAKIFEEAYYSFLKRFLNSVFIISEDGTKLAEKDFNCLIDFMNFRNELKGQTILDDMLPTDFIDKFNDINTKIAAYFKQHQKRYEEALENTDARELRVALETMKKWNPLFNKIKLYSDLYGGPDTPAKSLLEVLSQVKSYEDMVRKVSEKFKELRDYVLNVQLINDDTKKFVSIRNNFYEALNSKLAVLLKAKDLGDYSLSINVNTIKQECVESLEKKISELYVKAESLSDRFLNKGIVPRADYENFNILFNNLVFFNKNIKTIEIRGNKNFEKIDQKLLDRVYGLYMQAEANPSINNVAECLITMKVMSDNITSLKEKIDERIDEALMSYKSRQGGAAGLAKLGTILNQDKGGVGPSIIQEHKVFQGYSLSLFNSKTQKHGIEYVLQRLDGNDIDGVLLNKRYTEFQTEFQNLIQLYLKPDLELSQLIASTKLLAGNIIHEPNNIIWDADVRSKIPKLMSHIFALWTLKNATHYFEAQSLDDKENYLFQPHAAQVISIFRMLGIGDKKEELKNNLVQIGTGEGKSVALAISTSVLALLGFDVSCACYSEYLSQRDYTSFQSLFDSLNITNYIHYGTFNKVCEGVINQNGDIRKVVENLISKGVNEAMENNKNVQRPKMLLIDEVDIFFNKDFYGNTYTPSTSLRDPTITNLLNVIWNGRGSRWTLAKVKATNEYKACCVRFKDWGHLIDEAIKDMIFDLMSYETHDYVVNDDKIGYKEQDSIAYNVVYGYKTLFAYYGEHEKGKISKESLEKNKYIRVKCGTFSFAEIPRQFTFIMGVTGTLKMLSDPEKKVIQNVYGIHKNTYTPSVFGANNLRFEKKLDVLVENEHDYYNVIVQQIQSRMVGTSYGAKRAILVFFESKKKLLDFYNSRALAHLKDSVDFITEEASLQEKDNLVKRATSSGQITLLTRSFGRGTDFVCRDPIVEANNGVHVIQTFFSEELSEEVQIKGRTARQGDRGSYSMVLLDTSLEKFLVTLDDLDKIKRGATLKTRLISLLGYPPEQTYETQYDYISIKRDDQFKTQYEDNAKYVDVAKEQHDKSQKFLDALVAGNLESVKKFLYEENKGAEEVNIAYSKTLVLMDATGSMTHLLQKAKNTVGTMFERTIAILKENNIHPDCFQIQFAVYRNYNVFEDKLLQHSPWETKPANLRLFMEKIGPEGGIGNEAIEIGLWHANMENDNEAISQIILIGDVPPNTVAEVDAGRARYCGGEKYWQTTKFKVKTHYQQELAKLKAKNVQIHAFYVDRYAESSFKQIAAETRGRAELLDINSTAGAEMLTNLVTEEVLRNVGQANNGKGDALVNAYRSKFTKSHN